ncbi:MAG: hypothetical protein AAFY21_05840, partial [Cyanobacteria bacterium J06641_2]
LKWANQKSLSSDDTRYLKASERVEQKELVEALVTEQEEGKILAQANEELRQAQYKSEQANQTLKKAQKKSRRMIQIGAGFLILSLIGAIVAFVFAANAQEQRETVREEAKSEQAPTIIVF